MLGRRGARRAGVATAAVAGRGSRGGRLSTRAADRHDLHVEVAAPPADMLPAIPHALPRTPARQLAAVPVRAMAAQAHNPGAITKKVYFDITGATTNG